MTREKRRTILKSFRKALAVLLIMLQVTTPLSVFADTEYTNNENALSITQEPTINLSKVYLKNKNSSEIYLDIDYDFGQPLVTTYDKSDTSKSFETYWSVQSLTFGGSLEKKDGTIVVFEDQDALMQSNNELLRLMNSMNGNLGNGEVDLTNRSGKLTTVLNLPYSLADFDWNELENLNISIHPEIQKIERHFKKNLAGEELKYFQDTINTFRPYEGSRNSIVYLTSLDNAPEDVKNAFKADFDSNYEGLYYYQLNKDTHKALTDLGYDYSREKETWGYGPLDKRFNESWISPGGNFDRFNRLTPFMVATLGYRTNDLFMRTTFPYKVKEFQSTFSDLMFENNYDAFIQMKNSVDIDTVLRPFREEIVNELDLDGIGPDSLFWKPELKFDLKLRGKKGEWNPSDYSEEKMKELSLTENSFENVTGNSETQPNTQPNIQSNTQPNTQASEPKQDIQKESSESTLNTITQIPKPMPRTPKQEENLGKNETETIPITEETVEKEERNDVSNTISNQNDVKEKENTEDSEESEEKTVDTLKVLEQAVGNNKESDKEEESNRETINEENKLSDGLVSENGLSDYSEIASDALTVQLRGNGNSIIPLSTQTAKDYESITPFNESFGESVIFRRINETIQGTGNRAIHGMTVSTLLGDSNYIGEFVLVVKSIFGNENSLFEQSNYKLYKLQNSDVVRNAGDLAGKQLVQSGQFEQFERGIHRIKGLEEDTKYAVYIQVTGAPDDGKPNGQGFDDVSPVDGVYVFKTGPALPADAKDLSDGVSPHPYAGTWVGGAIFTKKEAEYSVGNYQDVLIDDNKSPQQPFDGNIDIMVKDEYGRLMPGIKMEAKYGRPNQYNTIIMEPFTPLNPLNRMETNENGILSLDGLQRGTSFSFKPQNVEGYYFDGEYGKNNIEVYLPVNKYGPYEKKEAIFKLGDAPQKPNNDTNAKLVIYKRDQQGNKLQGVEFDLFEVTTPFFGDDFDPTKVRKIDTKVTDAEGRIIFEGMENTKQYFVYENLTQNLAPLNPYVPYKKFELGPLVWNNEKHPVNKRKPHPHRGLLVDSFIFLNSNNQPLPGEPIINDQNDPAQPKDGTIDVFKKEDIDPSDFEPYMEAHGNRVFPEIEFELGYMEAGQFILVENKIADEYGYARFTGLQRGKEYLVREKLPRGWTSSSHNGGVARIRLNHRVVRPYDYVAFFNHRGGQGGPQIIDNYFLFKLLKVDDFGNPMKDVPFDLIWRQQITNQNTSTVLDKKLKTLTTDENGLIEFNITENLGEPPLLDTDNFNYAGLNNKLLILREQVPAGYEVYGGKNEIPFTFTMFRNEYMFNVTNRKTDRGDFEKIHLTLNKTLKNPDGTNEVAAPYVKFRIYYDDKSSKQQKFIREVVTNQQGIVKTTLEIPLDREDDDNFIIEEILPDRNLFNWDGDGTYNGIITIPMSKYKNTTSLEYNLSNDRNTHKQVPTDPPGYNKDGEEPIPTPPSDEPSNTRYPDERNAIKVIKKDHLGNPVRGKEIYFQLYRIGDKTGPGITSNNRELIAVQKTDENGETTFEDLDNNRRYFLREIPDRSYEFFYPASGSKYVTFDRIETSEEKEVVFYNKFKNAVNANDRSVKILKLDDKGNRMANVTFTLTYDSETKTGVTGTNGELLFTGLPQNKPMRLEEQLPNGYDYQSPANGVITFTTSQGNDASQTNITVINKKKGETNNTPNNTPNNTTPFKITLKLRKVLKKQTGQEEPAANVRFKVFYKESGKETQKFIRLIQTGSDGYLNEEFTLPADKKSEDKILLEEVLPDNHLFNWEGDGTYNGILEIPVGTINQDTSFNYRLSNSTNDYPDTPTNPPGFNKDGEKDEPSTPPLTPVINAGNKLKINKKDSFGNNVTEIPITFELYALEPNSSDRKFIGAKTTQNGVAYFHNLSKNQRYFIREQPNVLMDYFYPASGSDYVTFGDEESIEKELTFYNQFKKSIPPENPQEKRAEVAIYKRDHQGKPLSDIEFILYEMTGVSTAPKEISRQKTNGDGFTLFTGLLEKTNYKVEEVSTPQYTAEEPINGELYFQTGTALPDNNQTIHKGKWVGAYIFKNHNNNPNTNPEPIEPDKPLEEQPKDGLFEILKKDIDGRVMVGVDFDLYTYEENDSIPKRVHLERKQTGNYGLVGFNNLQRGRDYVVYERPPAGYTAVNPPYGKYNFTVPKDKALFYDNKTFYNDLGKHLEDTDDVTVVILKTADNGERLSNVLFQLYQGTGVNKRILKEVYTDSLGRAEIKQLPRNERYSLIEVPPAGYTFLSNPNGLTEFRTTNEEEQFIGIKIINKKLDKPIETPIPKSPTPQDTPPGGGSDPTNDPKKPEEQEEPKTELPPTQIQPIPKPTPIPNIEQIPITIPDDIPLIKPEPVPTIIPQDKDEPKDKEEQPLFEPSFEPIPQNFPIKPGDEPDKDKNTPENDLGQPINTEKKLPKTGKADNKRIYYFLGVLLTAIGAILFGKETIENKKKENNKNGQAE